MFGLISKKKLSEALERLCDAYDRPLPPKEQRVPQIDTYEFYCGNMNAVNYIAHRCGARLTRDGEMK